MGDTNNAPSSCKCDRAITTTETVVGTNNPRPHKSVSVGATCTVNPVGGSRNNEHRNCVIVTIDTRIGCGCGELDGNAQAESLEQAESDGIDDEALCTKIISRTYALTINKMCRT